MCCAGTLLSLSLSLSLSLLSDAYVARGTALSALGAPHPIVFDFASKPGETLRLTSPPAPQKTRHAIRHLHLDPNSREFWVFKFLLAKGPCFFPVRGPVILASSFVTRHIVVLSRATRQRRLLVAPRPAAICCAVPLLFAVPRAAAPAYDPAVAGLLEHVVQMLAGRDPQQLIAALAAAAVNREW
ncbi:hypothetical protein B0H11DRAFT_1907565 [Mycena galericulata]|nr:hypothetical protein B0H11DRAFT_1907565 [Mycena galericulata]